MRVHVSGADAPFWLVLGAVAEQRMEGDDRARRRRSAPSQLVDGYANGWLVHPTQRVVRRRARVDAATPGVGRALDLRARPRCCASRSSGWALVRRRSRGDRDAASRSDADVARRVAGAAAWHAAPRPARAGARSGRGAGRSPVSSRALIVAPWVGRARRASLLVAMQWRPRLRAVLVLGPAVLLALVTAYVVYLQHHFRFPPVFEWPTLFPLGRPLGWLAVVFLGVDVVVERVRGPRAPSPARIRHPTP